jgi:glycosyltransferase involved in cell wall biosynthesis
LSGPHFLVISGSRGIPLYGPSGASAHLRGVCDALIPHAEKVTVAVPRLVDHRGEVNETLRVQTTTFEPRQWSWLPRSVRERGECWDNRQLVRTAIREHGKPTAIYERHALFCDGGMQLAKRLRIPRVVELNAPLSLERRRYDPLNNPYIASRIEKQTLQSADQILAVSAWLANWAVDTMGCHPDKVVHAPNGVRVRLEGDRARVRRELGVEDKLVLGFVGSMKPWHGLERIPALLNTLPEAVLLVVGDGPTAPPAHPRILSVGRVAPDKLHHMVAAMDVGLAPYDSAAPPWFCPLKILEYRAQAVPVVAADIGDCRALIGEDGEAVGVNDPLVWASAIRRVAQLPRRYAIRSWDEVISPAIPVLLG